MRSRLTAALGLAGSLGAAAAAASAAALSRARPAGPGTTGPDPRGPGWAVCSPEGARVYEASLGRALTGLYRAMATDLATASTGVSPGRIVDVGAGPGGLVVALARAFPGARITAVDLDPEMAARARARMTREGLAERVEVVIADVTALPLPDESTDLVISSFSVHHWPDAAAGLAEVRRILRPGGRARVYDVPDWWGRLETRAPSLPSVVREAGLSARIDGLAWPGPIRLVRRVDLAR